MNASDNTVRAWYPIVWIGHNPAGWVADNGTSTSLPAIISTACADDDDDDKEELENEAGEEFWEEVHEFFANFMLLLIVLHVAGVLYSSYVEKENLPKAMY